MGGDPNGGMTGDDDATVAELALWLEMLRWARRCQAEIPGRPRTPAPQGADQRDLLALAMSAAALPAPMPDHLEAVLADAVERLGGRVPELRLVL